MRQAYVRELKPYSIAGLANEFGMEFGQTFHVVQGLMSRGIVRYRTDKSADGVDTSDEEGAKDDERYQFNFVGMAMVGDLVVVAYPKYFRDEAPSLDELRQIMRVLKHDAGRASVATLVDEGERTDDKLPVMLALLELYAEYGVYSNFVEGRELNGTGTIDWNRTIGNHLPILADGRPIYVEYESRKTLRDESDFITRLHRAVLTECSKQLFGAHVGDLLSLDEVELSDEEVDEFGDAETLEWRLEHERGAQFVDWKIATLDLLCRYLLNRESESEHDEVHTLGTTSFFHLWEVACKTAFGDVLSTKLGELGFQLKGEWAKRERDTLLGIIESPLWERPRDNTYDECEPVATLIPDTVSFATDDDGKRVFCIYDAKYYAPNVGRKIEKQPGLESVTKQFLYQSAYKDFVSDHDFKRVVNAFLLPTADDELHELAKVSFKGVMGEVKLPLSNHIYMWALPADKVFDAYLHREKIDSETIKAIYKSRDEHPAVSK